MDKKKQRLVELGKDALIVLLSCSAIYLGADILLPGGVGSLWQEKEHSQSGVVQQQGTAMAAWPVRMAVSSWNGESTVRMGVQYDRESCDAQFEPVASLLREAISDPGVARTVTRREWERALSRNSSLYFDLLGEIPFPVLSSWLTGSDCGLTGTVRRLVLAAEGDVVTLYYRDEVSGSYFASRSALVTSEQIRAVTETALDNGVEFAFALDEYSDLAGDTMLQAETPRPKVYAAANPLAGEGQLEEITQDGVLGKMLMALSFPHSSYIYSGTDQVIRSGSDTLRISSRGTVRYAAERGEASRYQIPSQGAQLTEFEMAEACRNLAEGAAGSLAGDARLYLREMSKNGEEWLIDFGYCLDGTAVQVGDSGYAARFKVEGREITQFILRLRTYTDTGARSFVLPERQAMAAMEALDAQGRELMLVYRDVGGDTVSAGWVAD